MRLITLVLTLLTVNGGHTQESSAAVPAAIPRGPIEFLQSEMKKQQIPGAQLAVVRHGELIALGAFGLANIEHKVPANVESIFAINSCTKAFTGVALMQLVDEGKLDLNAPVSRYLDSLPVAWRAVTLRQMATNMSGLPEYFLGTRMLVDGDIEASWARVQTLPVVFKAGERVQYNQTNWLLLQRIIEKLTGESFAQFVTERQFNVVGMPRTAQAGWADDFSIQPGKAKVYSNIRNVTKSGDWGDWPGGQDFIVNTHQLSNNVGGAFVRAQNSGSGLESTAQEIARWLVALQEGKLVSKASLKDMWTPGVLNDGTPGMWAIGWPSYQRQEHPVVLPTGGGRSAFAVYPDDDLAVVLLTNLLGAWPERFIDEIAAYYLPDPSMHRANGFGLSPRLKPLHTELAQRDFGAANAEAVVKEMQAKDPTFGSVDDLRTYGLHLFWTAQYNEAMPIFELNTRLHSDSALAYETLAAAYELNGEEVLAERTHSIAGKLMDKSRPKRGEPR